MTEDSSGSYNPLRALGGASVRCGRGAVYGDAQIEESTATAALDTILRAQAAPLESLQLPQAGSGADQYLVAEEEPESLFLVGDGPVLQALRDARAVLARYPLCRTARRRAAPDDAGAAERAALEAWSAALERGLLPLWGRGMVRNMYLLDDAYLDADTSNGLIEHWCQRLAAQPQDAHAV